MRYNDNIGIAAEVNRVQLTFTAIDRRKGTDYMSEQKKKISKLCLAGFILAIMPWNWRQAVLWIITGVAHTESRWNWKTETVILPGRRTKT